MPYIPPNRRKDLQVTPDWPATSGELNYTITREILEYIGFINDNGWTSEDLEEILGVLECVKQEVWRRLNIYWKPNTISLSQTDYNYTELNRWVGNMIAQTMHAQYKEDLSSNTTTVTGLYREVIGPYEDEKIKENGDLEWGQ